jgi:hypothetical protein
MTDKRFMYELHGACFRDNGVAMTTGEVIHTLNELHEQLETCKDANTRCCNEYSAMRRDVFRYKKENEHIKHTIKTMMENERTKLGQSVLRQLYEAIQ